MDIECYVRLLREQLLRDIEGGEPRQAFARFCRKVVRAIDDDVIPVNLAGLTIASTMWIPEIDSDPQLEEITMIAGSLEVPMPKRHLRVLLSSLKGALSELERDTRTSDRRTGDP